MMWPMDRLTLDLEPALDAIHRVGLWLDELVETESLAADRRFGLELALDELLTNTITYGFSGRDNGRISISVAGLDGGVRVTIEDDADAFDPFSVPPPDIEARLDDRRVGGLGIHFVRKFTDAFRYRREDGRNIVELDVAGRSNGCEEL
jgi:serine/threonine-protein kinase RsbW